MDTSYSYDFDRNFGIDLYSIYDLHGHFGYSLSSSHIIVYMYNCNFLIWFSKSVNSFTTWRQWLLLAIMTILKRQYKATTLRLYLLARLSLFKQHMDILHIEFLKIYWQSSPSNRNSSVRQCGHSSLVDLQLHVKTKKRQRMRWQTAKCNGLYVSGMFAAGMWPSSWSLKSVEVKYKYHNVQPMCDFLFCGNSNTGPVFYRLRDIYSRNVSCAWPWHLEWIKVKYKYANRKPIFD